MNHLEPSRRLRLVGFDTRSRVIAGRIGLRLVAGLDYDEIAAELHRTRPKLRHLELPPKVTKGWVSGRFRGSQRDARELATTTDWTDAGGGGRDALANRD